MGTCSLAHLMQSDITSLAPAARTSSRIVAVVCCLFFYDICKLIALLFCTTQHTHTQNKTYICTFFVLCWIVLCCWCYTLFHLFEFMCNTIGYPMESVFQCLMYLYMDVLTLKNSWALIMGMIHGRQALMRLVDIGPSGPVEGVRFIYELRDVTWSCEFCIRTVFSECRVWEGMSTKWCSGLVSPPKLCNCGVIII